MDSRVLLAWIGCLSGLATACAGEEFCETTRTCPLDASDAGSDGDASGASDSGVGAVPTRAESGGAGSGDSSGTDGGSAGDGDASGGSGDVGGRAAGDPREDAGMSDGSDGPDLVAPAVVSVTPENEATGVVKESPIVIRFSEPMNRALTAGAFSASSFAAASMEWSEDDRVLTIEPFGLEYAEGDDPSTTVAKQYQYSMATTATDKAGNRLALGQVASFSTLRQLTHVYEIGATGADTSGHNTGKEYGRCSTDSVADYDELPIGDSSTGETFQTFLQFSFEELADNVHFIVAADLTVKTGIVNDIYALLPFLIEGVAVPSIHESQTSPIAAIGTPISTNLLEADSSYGFDVTSLVEDAYSNGSDRGHRVQFRLRFQVANDGDGMTETADILCEGTQLAVEYLAP